MGSSDVVPGPLDGTAEHHAKDHPKDLCRGGDRRDGIHQFKGKTVLNQHDHHQITKM